METRRNNPRKTKIFQTNLATTRLIYTNKTLFHSYNFSPRWPLFPIFKISLLKIVRHTVHVSKKLSLNKSNTHMKYLVFELRDSVAFLETNFLSICPTAQEQDYVIIKWFRDFLLSVDCFGHTAFKNGPSKRTNVTKCLGLCYLIALLKATKHNWIFSRPELF